MNRETRLLAVSLAAGAFVAAQLPCAARALPAASGAGASSTAAPSTAAPSTAAPSTAAPSTAAGGSATATATASASAQPSAAPSVSPPVPAHGMSPHGQMPSLDDILKLKGSPYDSDQHRMLASLVRRGHSAQPQSQVISSAEVTAGTVGILVQDGTHQPLAHTKVELRGVHKSIAEGDKEFTFETTTDDQGRAAFRGQNTDTSYDYEVVVQRDGATYSSGNFGFDHGKGAIVSLYVFPATRDMNQTLIFSRALYAIEPRADVFAVQALYRFHNAGASTWSPVEFPIRLPPSASAFQPGNAAGVELREADGNVLVSGTFPPGQKEFSFAFHVPNPRTERAEVRLPSPPHLVDAKVVVESSKHMGLTVPGFNPAQRTQSPDGAAALLSDQDFLQPGGHAPQEILAIITGMPPKSPAPLYAVAMALVVALGGLVHASSNGGKRGQDADGADQSAARRLIVDELVRLEAAREAKEIGPKTYDRTRRLLVDALARLDLRGEPQRADGQTPEHASGA